MSRSGHHGCNPSAGGLRRILPYCLAAALATALPGAGSPGADPSTQPPVILISVDTLRADHLGCYGAKAKRTPHIDALAHRATLFSQVSSQVPLTLPSHVSLLTSTYPFSNGVEDNGQRLGPGAVTLATILKSKGYRTAAIVGGFVLDRRFGLDQGFDFYDSPFDLHKAKGMNPGEIKRLGEDVVQSATSWIEENTHRPFFLFLHLYDLHTPYNLPASLQARYAPGYEGELSYVDGVLGRFWEVLRRNGILDKSLIVFLADHGEGLGNHSESTHGYYIYQSTLRVPLILHWPAAAGNYPLRIDEPLSLLDVAPTILQFLGIQPPPQFQGHSLLGLLEQKSPGRNGEVYSESLYARNHFSCSALGSLRMGRYKFIEAPKPEFYDLSRDPEESRNLYSSQKSLALNFRERLLSLRSRFKPTGHAAPTAPDPEVVEKLAALGYVAVTSARAGSPDSGADPKDLISEFESWGDAMAQAGDGDLPGAMSELEQLLSSHPELVDVRLTLAQYQQQSGQHQQAIENFRQALKLDPLNFLAHFNLAVSYFALQQIDLAIKEADATLAIAPFYTDADELLGTIYLQKGEIEQARIHYSNILKTAPSDYAAHYNLGAIAMVEGAWEEGERHLLAALETEPQSSEAHNVLGSLYVRRGDLELARRQFGEAVRLDPGFAMAHYNLGLILREQKKVQEAIREFQAALAADPQLSVARDELLELQASHP